MRVLGMDHGNTICGYGVVDFDLQARTPTYIEHGIFRNTFVHYPVSLLEYSEQFEKLIIRFQPDRIAFEGQKDMRGYKPTQRLFEMVGSLKAVAVKHRVPFLDIPPNTMKKIVADYGFASKEEVARSLARIFNIPFEDIVVPIYYKTGIKKGQIKELILDGTDALGLALSYPLYRKRVGKDDFDGQR